MLKRMRYSALATQRTIRLLLVFGSLVPLAAALVSQYAFHFAPCQLCLLQRIPYVIVLILAALALLKPLHSRRWLALALLAWTIGFGLATYHFAVELGLVGAASSCGGGTLPADASIEQLRAAIAQSPLVSCGQAMASFLGLSMAGWNMLLQLGLLVSGMLLLRHARRHTRKAFPG